MALPCSLNGIVLESMARASGYARVPKPSSTVAKNRNTGVGDSAYDSCARLYPIHVKSGSESESELVS